MSSNINYCEVRGILPYGYSTALCLTKCTVQRSASPQATFHCLNRSNSFQHNRLLLSMPCPFSHRTCICIRQVLVLALLPVLSIRDPSAPTLYDANLHVGVKNTLTCHLANRKSISPLLSACSLGCSLRDRRTTRAATARYRLYLTAVSGTFVWKQEVYT